MNGRGNIENQVGMIEGMPIYPEVTQTINIPYGYSIISFYIDPNDRHPESIFKGVTSNLHSIRDASGGMPSITGWDLQGEWDADLDSPVLPAASASNANQFYIVSVPGTTTKDGNSEWAIGDLVQSNGTVWVHHPLKYMYKFGADIKQITELMPGVAYKIIATAACTIHVKGRKIVPESTPIVFSQDKPYISEGAQGANYFGPYRIDNSDYNTEFYYYSDDGFQLDVNRRDFAYLRDTPMDAALALAAISANINTVKGENGLVYWPAFGYNSIGDLIPGTGYIMNGLTPCTLYYPAND